MVAGKPVLLGRRSECELLDRLLEEARHGRGAVLVVRGEAGIGKTALLDYAVHRAQGLRVARVAGVESEMELPFAALRQLCEPMLGQLGALPGPQRDAQASSSLSCTSLTTRSGWTVPQRRRLPSWLAAC
jgi:predicted ATPase